MQWDLQSVVSFLLSRTPTPELGTRPLVVLLAALLILFLWYCYRVGTEDQDSENGGGGAARRARRSIGTMRGLSIAGSAAGLDHSDLGIIPIGGPEHGGYFAPILTSPPFPNPGQASPGNRKLYRNLQEYAKRYTWAGMGRVHKGVREQGRYLASRPSIQKPEVFFLPDLPTSPYFSREAQKHDVELLERSWSVLLAEFEAVHQAFSNCSLSPSQGWKANSTPHGEWHTFYLVNQGVSVPQNCRRCPRAYRILGSLRTFIGNNVFGNACFSVLSPGTLITEHYGPTNVRIRCHLGLKIPSSCELVVGGEPQCWAEGSCLLFDDSFLHTAFHEGSVADGPRVVFMVDLWHPNVAAAERQALDYIFTPGR